MTFRQRLIMIFSIVLVLPVILLMIAFLIIGNYMTRSTVQRTTFQDYVTLSDSISYEQDIDGLVETIERQLQKDPDALTREDYRSQITTKLSGYNAALLIRRGKKLYYADDPAEAKKLLSILPAYGSQEEDWISVSSPRRMVRQLDFTFSDGDEGSLFIVVRVMGLISRQMMWGMLAAMVVILVITAILLVRWVQGNLFAPINELNKAMNNIRDGNLDYMLPTGEQGEIGELYRNYEEMRLRLKESTQEKIEREKQNRELIRNISHDLKTPVTSIRGYAEGLLDGVARTPEKQERYVRTIYNKAGDMTNLINELTLYSQIDSDRIPYNFRPINVADYFADCVEELGMDLESRGIGLDYSSLVSPDTVVVADPEQLKRVINNIVSNSVKYMDKEQKQIQIRLQDEQDSVRVEIEDNGPGIAPEDLPRIFDRFYRTDASRNSSKGGSGIGLSIVKKIIEDHGGYIWATSREGQGTCLHFLIRKYRKQENQENTVDV